MNLKAAFAALASAAGIVCVGMGSAQATDITLQYVASYDRSSPFGLAFDGTYIWWSDSSRVVHQMTTDGVDTGVTFSGPAWSELAWNGAQLMMASGGTIYTFDTDGANVSSQSVSAGYVGGGLQDGLDWDNGELWISPDVSNVYRLSGDLSSFVGASPFLGGAGGYSGVERIQATDGTDYIVVVNDAKQPRELCVHTLGGALIGCQQFANARYEGLAFDGRYVYAADFYGHKIDKFDILGDGGSIIDPGGEVPLPAALPLMLFGLAGLGAATRRKRG